MSIPQRYAHIDFSVTDAMQEAAQSGLDRRAEHGRGGTEVGVARARDIINREALPPDTWRRVLSFFQRHEVNDRSDATSAAAIAWALWGGDAGYSRARRIVSQMTSADESEKSMGTTLKRLGNKQVGGYLVRFTGPDEPDLHGEWFTPDTDFMMSVHPPNGKPVLFQHGFDPAIQSVPLGTLKNVRKDDEGIYAEADISFAKNYALYLKELGKAQEWYDEQVREAEDYEEMLMRLVDDGKLSWSSGTLQQAAKRADNGAITRWPIAEGTLTPTPAEPRYTGVQTLKSTWERLLKGLKDGGQGEPEAASDNQTKTDNDILGIKGVTIMPTRDEIKDAIAPMVAEMVDAVLETIGLVEDDEAKMEIEEEIEEMARTAYQDETDKMDDEEEADKMDDDDDKRKSAYRLLAKRQSGIISKGVEKGLAIKRDRRESMRKQAEASKSRYASQPAQSPKDGAGGYKQDAVPVSVGDDLKYAHLSPEQMALGIKLAAVPYRNLPGGEKRVKLGDMVSDGTLSEEYIRAAVHKMARASQDATPPQSGDPLAQQDYHAMKSAMPFKADELNAVAITNQGAEWPGIFYDTQLWDRARERTDLFNLMSERGMRIVDIPQGARSMNVKLDTGSGKVYTINEARNTDATGRPEVVAGISPFTTDEVQEEPATHMIATGITYELQEDSIIDALAFVYEDNAQELAEALEGAMLNGDKRTGANVNINAIDGTPAGGLQKPPYLGFNGIRLNYLPNVDFRFDKQNDSLDIRDFETVRALMPTAIRNRKSELLFIIDESVESNFRRLIQVLLQDTAGNQATAFTGDLFDPFGIKMYASFALTPANANGLLSVDAANNTRGNIALVYPRYWQYGRKRQITVETERYMLSQTQVVGMSIRHAFRARGDAASAGMYNIQA